MTILTPTSNAGAGNNGDQVSALPDDSAILNRLATEFFSLFPGSTHSPAWPESSSPAQSNPVNIAGLDSGAERGFEPGAGGFSSPVIEASQPAYVQPAVSPFSPQVPNQYAASLPVQNSTLGKPSPGTNSAPTSFYFLENDFQPPKNTDLDSLARQAQTQQGMNGQTHGVAAQGNNSEQGQFQIQRILNELALGSSAPSNGPAPFYFQQEEQIYWDKQPEIKQQSIVAAPFDINAVRRDFPILSERVNGKQLVWFDNAATTQKPQSVIDRLAYFYAHENSNIHRAAHELAARATDAYESARNKVRDFLGAASSEEIIFVRGATEGINLIAQTFGKKFIGAGDEIIVSHLEHHANIVPWQQLAAEKGAKIRVIPVDDTGQILLDEFAKLLNSRTKLVSVTQVSNALGTVTPIKQIIDLAHRAGAKVLIDGAQAVSHLRVNVRALDADFYVFSGHKVFGPTGIGAVYGKKELLNQLPPWQGGGNMISDVTFERTQYQPAPSRFEAGTGNIADAVGLGAAIDYVQRLGLENIALYEHALLEYATHGLLSIPGVRLIGTALEKASVASFVLEGYKTEEVGKALNDEGIAVRSGHHCAQPILRRFGVEATVRPSFAFYNTCEEIDRLIAVVRRLAGTKR